MKKYLSFFLFLLATNYVIACDLPDGFKAVEHPTPIKLNDYQPEPHGWTLLNLWAIWCAPCRLELPLLDQYQSSQPPIKINVLNLNDGESAAKKVFAELHINHLSPQSTTDSDALSKLNVIGLPYTALIYDGKLIATKSGILKETKTITDFIYCKQQEKP